MTDAPPVIELDRSPTGKEEAEDVFSTPQERMHAAKLAHDRATHAAELGTMGKWLGGEKHAPTFIAAIGVFIGLAIWAGCEIAVVFEKGRPDFWAQQAERAFAFASAALAFIFGRGSKPNGG